MEADPATLAPVLVTVYNRKAHLERAVARLLQCPEAAHTVLYISSDAAAYPQDEASIEAVRNSIREITGFREVIPILHPQNRGLKKAYELSLEVILDRFPWFILLEDDVEVSPDFLSFMNASLRFYEQDPRVFSVSAFSFSALLDGARSNRSQEVYFANRFCPWGFGMWKSKMLPGSTYTIQDVEESLDDPVFVKRLNENGADLLPAFATQVARNKMLELDYLNTYHMVRNDLYTIIPYQSKSFNRGHDGSGNRTTVSGRYLHANTDFLNAPNPFQLVEFSPDKVDYSIHKQHFRNWKHTGKLLLWKLKLLGLVVAFTDKWRGRK